MIEDENDSFKVARKVLRSYGSEPTDELVYDLGKRIYDATKELENGKLSYPIGEPCKQTHT